MHKYRVLLAACALATAVLVGCKQPIGLPKNDVRAASTCTTYIHVASDQSPHGYVSKWVDGQTPNGWYALTPDSIIQRYLHLEGGYVYPRRYGYCYFHVPHFTSSGAVPVCTLFYNQKYTTGYLNLIFNWVSGLQTWLPPAESLWKGIDTSSHPLAPKQGVQSNGWCKLALSNSGAAIIDGIAEANPSGAPLFTGWKFDNGCSDDSTGVYGVDPAACEPYIKVVYYPAP